MAYTMILKPARFIVDIWFTIWKVLKRGAGKGWRKSVGPIL
jgi:hypothetical protein